MQQGPPGHTHDGLTAGVLDEATGAAVWRASYLTGGGGRSPSWKARHSDTTYCPLEDRRLGEEQRPCAPRRTYRPPFLAEAKARRVEHSGRQGVLHELVIPAVGPLLPSPHDVKPYLR